MAILGLELAGPIVVVALPWLVSAVVLAVVAGKVHLAVAVVVHRVEAKVPILH